MRGSADRSVHCDVMSIEGTRVQRCVPAIAGDRVLRVRWGEISAQKGNPKPPRKAGLYAGRRLGDTGVALRRVNRATGCSQTRSSCTASLLGYSRPANRARNGSSAVDLGDLPVCQNPVRFSPVSRHAGRRLEQFRLSAKAVVSEGTRRPTLIAGTQGKHRSDLRRSSDLRYLTNVRS